MISARGFTGADQKQPRKPASIFVINGVLHPELPQNCYRTSKLLKRSQNQRARDNEIMAQKVCSDGIGGKHLQFVVDKRTHFSFFLFAFSELQKKKFKKIQTNSLNGIELDNGKTDSKDYESIQRVYKQNLAERLFMETAGSERLFKMISQKKTFSSSKKTSQATKSCARQLR